MSTVTGGTVAHRCRKFGFGCLFVAGAAIWGQAHAQAGATPGGAVPKDDPWKSNQQEALSIDIPKVSIDSASCVERTRLISRDRVARFSHLSLTICLLKVL